MRPLSGKCSPNSVRKLDSDGLKNCGENLQGELPGQREDKGREKENSNDPVPSDLQRVRPMVEGAERGLFPRV